MGEHSQFKRPLRVARGALGGEELAEPVTNRRVPAIARPPSWTRRVVKSCTSEWTQGHAAARVPEQYAGTKRFKPSPEAADRFRGVARWWVGGEELAERTRVREQLSDETSLRRESAQRRISRREGRQRAASVRRIGSELLVLVGHPGLEPGANGLRIRARRRHSSQTVRIRMRDNARSQPIRPPMPFQNLFVPFPGVR
jgi:hypothetical protein